METHHLDRGVEPVSVFALVGLVEGGLDGGDAFGGHGAGLQRHLGGVLLVLVAELAEARELDRRRRDAFVRKAAPRALLRLAERGLDGGGVPGSEIRRGRVTTSSRRRSDISMPQAENTEASAGTTTLVTPSSWASATACIAPPPPNAIQREVRAGRTRG